MSDAISYVSIPARNEIRVFIGIKRVGTIVKLPDGFEYRPKGSSHLRGEKFETLASCKTSLESPI